MFTYLSAIFTLFYVPECNVYVPECNRVFVTRCKRIPCKGF